MSKTVYIKKPIKKSKIKRILSVGDKKEVRTGQNSGKSNKVATEPIAYVIQDAFFPDLEVKNTANAWWVDKAKVDRLISAFKIDATVGEARVFAGISPKQYEYFKDCHPTFEIIIANCRELPVLNARTRVAKGVKESYANAMDYLKRKKRDEFGDRAEMDLTINKDDKAKIQTKNSLLDNIFSKKK